MSKRIVTMSFWRHEILFEVLAYCTPIGWTPSSRLILRMFTGSKRITATHMECRACVCHHAHCLLNRSGPQSGGLITIRWAPVWQYFQYVNSGLLAGPIKATVSSLPQLSRRPMQRKQSRGAGHNIPNVWEIEVLKEIVLIKLQLNDQINNLLRTSSLMIPFCLVSGKPK